MMFAGEFWREEVRGSGGVGGEVLGHALDHLLSTEGSLLEWETLVSARAGGTGSIDPESLDFRLARRRVLT